MPEIEIIIIMFQGIIEEAKAFDSHDKAEKFHDAWMEEQFPGENWKDEDFDRGDKHDIRWYSAEIE